MLSLDATDLALIIKRLPDPKYYNHDRVITYHYINQEFYPNFIRPVAIAAKKSIPLEFIQKTYKQGSTHEECVWELIIKNYE